MILLKKILFLIFFMMCPLITYAGSGIDQILIPSGEYTLGSLYCEEEQGNADWCKDESPRKIKLDAFRIDKYEVSNDNYRECFIAGVCEPSVLHDDRPNDFNKPLQPVVFVNWKDARAYCVWREGDLPTEAQWEVAAEGKKLGGAHFGQPYGNGAPVNIGKFEANSNGLYDMMGNVYEWTRYSLDDSSSAPTLKNKVVRGGSWSSPSHYLRTSDRVAKDPELRYSDVGFRCVNIEK